MERGCRLCGGAGSDVGGAGARARARWPNSGFPVVAAPLTAIVGRRDDAGSRCFRRIGRSIGRRGAICAGHRALHGRRLLAGGRVLAEDSPRMSGPPARRNRHRERRRGRTRGGRARPVGGNNPRGPRGARKRDETKHFKLIGTTGTGKSTAIREMLSRRSGARGPRRHRRSRRRLSATASTIRGRGDVILNPFDAALRQMGPVRRDQDAYDVEQLARSLIPDHEGRIAAGAAMRARSSPPSPARAIEAGVRDVAELYRLWLIADTKSCARWCTARRRSPSWTSTTSKCSIRSAPWRASAVGALEYIARAAGSDFSVRCAGSRERPPGGVLFMPYKAGQIAALRSAISALDAPGDLRGHGPP